MGLDSFLKVSSEAHRSQVGWVSQKRSALLRKREMNITKALSHMKRKGLSVYQVSIFPMIAFIWSVWLPQKGACGCHSNLSLYSWKAKVHPSFLFLFLFHIGKSHTLTLLGRAMITVFTVHFMGAHFLTALSLIPESFSFQKKIKWKLITGICDLDDVIERLSHGCSLWGALLVWMVLFAMI